MFSDDLCFHSNMYKDTDCIRRELELPGSKWGFVIYRLTYKSDDQWKQFMDHLKTRTRLELESTKDGDLYDRIGWTVIEEYRLRYASISQVRRRVSSCQVLNHELTFAVTSNDGLSVAAARRSTVALLDTWLASGFRNFTSRLY
jgi:hypothetical protein